MTVLKIVSSEGINIGMISWFAVHATSMNNTNTMISSDNKGYAAQLMENTFNPGELPGKGSFVAAFAQSNEATPYRPTCDHRCTRGIHYYGRQKIERSGFVKSDQ